MQMPLTLSDAEIRRLRDHEVLLTHVGITTLTSEEFRASADRIVNKFSQLTTQNITKLNSEVGFKTLLGELKMAKIAKAVKEDAELVFSLARMMGLIDDTFEGSSLDVLILAHERACAMKSNAAIATVAAPATAPAANTPTAAPAASGSGHDKSGLQSANDNRYETVTITSRVLLSKITKDAQKAAKAVEQQKASDAAAAEARNVEQSEAAKNKAELERIRKADANRLGFQRVGQAEHQAALMDRHWQFEVSSRSCARS